MCIGFASGVGICDVRGALPPPNGQTWIFAAWAAPDFAGRPRPLSLKRGFDLIFLTCFLSFCLPLRFHHHPNRI
jgi:hypothetical protein